MAEHMDYRLALLLPESRQLLGIEASLTPELPRISIPTGERSAEQLSKLVEQKWRVKTIVLDILADEFISTRCAVMEVRNPSRTFKYEGLRPIQPDSISNASLGEKERHIVLAIMLGDALNRGPFARIGWAKDAQQWIQDEVPGRTIKFNDDILQFTAGGRCALVRFGTQEDPAYWLKAVGEPNRHEFEVTKALAERFPNHVPTIVAMRNDWNAWVMEETGHPLCDSFTLPSIERAVVGLAELQRESVDHVKPLLAAGCFDQTIPVLEAHLREITEYLEDAMNRQTSKKVPGIDVRRLRELEHILHRACSRMQELHVPNALIHNDINGGNILLRGTSCVFTDWAEACIGNPFFTFQHLCAQISRDSEHAGAWLPQVKHAYKKAWIECLTEAQIDLAFALMPILGITSYLYGRGTWLNSTRRDDRHFQSYSRSLARCMDRAARAPELLEALCQ